MELGEEGVVEVGHFGGYTEEKWPAQTWPGVEAGSEAELSGTFADHGKVNLGVALWESA